MNKEVKDIIAEKMAEYMTKENLSGRKFSALSGVSEEIISGLKNGRDYTSPEKGKKQMILVRYYKMVAKTIGYKLEKEYWDIRQTPQFVQMLDYLEDAKEFGYTRVFIGETGCGKTFVSDIFLNHNVKEVFKITVGSTDTISDLLDKIFDCLKIEASGSKSKKIREIVKRLTTMHLDGLEPMIIFDEAEYLKQASLCNMKELIDHLKGKASVIMIGTNQLERKIDALQKKDKDGIPQFASRISLCKRYIRNIDTSFNEFLSDFEDQELVKFCQRFCSDYRNLHDLLVPAMREADKLQVPLTLDFVKRYHGLK